MQRDQEAYRRRCRFSRHGFRVGCSWEVGHRPGGFGRGRLGRGAPTPQFLTAADDTYLMVLGGVVYTAVPFYKRARKIEGETLNNAETAVEVVEHVAEVTEKLAANAAESLPENGSLQKFAVEIEYIAEVVDKDAHKVEVVIKKIEEVSDKIDAAVEPVIEALEKDFKPNPTSSTGSDAQK